MVNFTSDGIFCTHAPIASAFSSAFQFRIDNITYVPNLPERNYCPFGARLIGKPGISSYCRFVYKKWNY